LFGAFTTSMTVFVTVLGADPNNTTVYLISVVIAAVIGTIHYRKIFG